MSLAQTPEDEQARLEELRSYGVLDSGRDESFDEVVSLLADMLDVPVALISLVDENRQWFKARHGFDTEETDLEQSICAHAILQDDILEIEDTERDLRSADNPLVCGLVASMRFYAGAPLVTRAGHRIGALCVLDTKPRKLTAQQRSLLRVMASQVMRQLDLARALRYKEVLREEIDHRVKNSLQTVASTIRLYRSRIDSEDARDALDAISRRVDAISQLHAELNQTSTLHTVRLDAYLDRVAQLLQRTAPDGVSVKSDGIRVEVDSRVAAALGVIASEFAANSAKYAFADGNVEGGEILFSVSPGDDENLQFVCSDNGAERLEPDQRDPLVSASLGERLMEAAAQQVGGSLTQTRESAGFVLRARVPRSPSRGAPQSGERLSR